MQEWLFSEALLFAAHPVHVEAVTWLAARKEVIQGFFFFLAFYLYLKGREEEGSERDPLFRYRAFLLLLATLSKPSAVVFPGVIHSLRDSQEKGRGMYKVYENNTGFL